MDLITHLLETKHGNTAIVVFVPLSLSIGPMQYATLFVREESAKHGLPESIISDRLPRFTSDFFGQLYELLGIKQCMSTVFHPQSDGQTERVNRNLGVMLRASARKEAWDI